MEKLDVNTYKILDKAFKENGLVLTEELYFKFETYYEFLIEYNQNVNLTAITEKKEIFLKHFADSLSAIKYIPKNATVCDIGTGAGFPGVVLKLARSDINLTLVDSLNKRILFLNELLNRLNITATVLHNRAEDKDFKEKFLNSFDVVVSRAVAEMVTLSEYCLPFVKVGGMFVAYKSINVSQETIRAKKCVKILGGNEPEQINYKLNDELEHSLLLIKKIKPTDKKYPRGQNQPKDKPLL